MSPEAVPPPCHVLDTVESMVRITREIENHGEGAGMLSGILDAVLAIFDADRAWVLEQDADDPEVWNPLMERTRPEWPGATDRAEILRLDDYHRPLVARCLETERPVASLWPDRESDIAARYGIRSQLVLAISPRGRSTLLLGMHHCRRACSYGDAEGLFFAVASRLSDALATFRAAESARQSEERFRTLVDHAPEAIVILDGETGIFTDANRGAERLFGLERSAFLDRLGPIDFSPEFQPDGRPSGEAARDWIGRAVAGGAPTFEWTHVGRDGAEIPCEISLVRLPHPTRPLVRGSMTDISDRKRAERERRALEAQLVQAQKLEAVGQLTGGVAHDFNNLLTVITGNVDLARQFPEDRDLVESALEQVDAAADRASSLTSRLLAFSRKQPLRPHAVSMGDLLRGMDDMLRRTLGETIELEVVVAGGIWPCEADPSQLESAILNLCVNARDAMPDGGRLTVESGNAYLDDEYAAAHGEVRPGQYVVVAVTDNGVGMPPEIMASVFEPFFTTKDVGKGSGLGLSMVYGFAKQSGGHVKIYSEQGEGTTVKLYLPRAAADTPAPRDRGRAAELPRGRGEKILVVEDAPELCRLVERILTDLGYRVVTAGHAAAALQALAVDPDIDLLFTDVVLPGGRNGAQLAKEARRDRPELAVLFTSGYTANAIIHNGRLDRDVRLVQKPFTRDELGRRVREALDERGAGNGPAGDG